MTHPNRSGPDLPGPDLPDPHRPGSSGSGPDGPDGSDPGRSGVSLGLSGPGVSDSNPSDSLGRTWTVEEMLGWGTATLYEASGLDCALDPGIRPAWVGARMAGPAYPVTLHPGDNLPLHRALERVAAGEVLVVDAGGARHGYWGEILAVAAQHRGVAGLVIDGGVRDVDRLAELGFPVFSRWVAVHRTSKHDPGRLGEPAVVGGVPVARGDLVVADIDGVVAIPAAVLPAVREKARERVAKEDRFLTAIRQGQSTLDLYGWR